MVLTSLSVIYGSFCFMTVSSKHEAHILVLVNTSIAGVQATRLPRCFTFPQILILLPGFHTSRFTWLPQDRVSLCATWLGTEDPDGKDPAPPSLRSHDWVPRRLNVGVNIPSMPDLWMAMVCVRGFGGTDTELSSKAGGAGL